MTFIELFQKLDVDSNALVKGLPPEFNLAGDVSEDVLVKFIRFLLDTAMVLKTERKWHIEPPTEEGQYFVAYRWGLDNQIMHDMAKQICYGATVFSHGTWKLEFPFVVLAWQKIEPFEEAAE